MTDFVTPVLRLVQGSVLQGNTKNRKGQPLVDKSGQPRTSYFLAGALKKTKQYWWQEDGVLAVGETPNNFTALIYQTGMQGYPQLFNPDGTCKKRDFAFKVMDGDGVDDDGNDNRQKEGFAGHWVFKFSNGFCPKAFMNGAYTQDPNAIKRGSFIRVYGSMAPNTGSESPGVYLNHSGVEFIAYGAEITSGPDLSQMVAQQARPLALPAGATLTPPAPSGLQAMGGPGTPAAMVLTGPGAMPPGAVQVPQTAQPAPAGLPPMPGSMPAPSNLQPNHGFVQNVIGGPAAGLPGLPALNAAPPALPPLQPAAPVYQMAAAAGTLTREALNAQGYTDEQLLAAGYMTRVA